MGIVSSYSGLLAARWFLGVTEVCLLSNKSVTIIEADGYAQSGFFPAATFLLTLWYRRYEVQRRMAVFYIAASLSGAFSGLLAYAIQKLDGRSGLAGWQWYANP
jgi:MFS family permease